MNFEDVIFIIICAGATLASVTGALYLFAWIRHELD